MRTVPGETMRLTVAISTLASRLAGRFGIGRRIAGEGAWVAGGQIVSAIAALVSIRIITELLTPDEFGRLALLAGVAALALGLAVEPLLQGVLRFYADWKHRGDGAVLRSASAAMLTPIVIVASATLVFTGWIGGAALGLSAVASILVAALFALDAVRSFELALFNAARRQKPTAFLYAATACTRPLAAFATVSIWGASAEAALAGYVAGSALVVIAIRALIPLEGRGVDEASISGRSFLHTGAGQKLTGELLHYAVPLAPLAILGWFNGVGDRYVIGGVIGLEDAGLYAAAYGLVSRPFLMLGTMTELVMRPVLFDAIAASDAGRVRRVKQAWLSVVATGSAFGAICFVLLGVHVGDLLLAPGYREAAVSMMIWIALGYAFHNMSVVHIRFCYAFKDTRAVLVLTVASSATMLAVLLLFLQLYGLIGAAMAVPVYFGLQWALAFAAASRAERIWTPSGAVSDVNER